jgi:GT2 family glycosyltransferase
MEALAVCQHFPFVQYFTGPKRGLCANRNAAISHTRTDYVSLIDDDGIVGPTFVENLQKILPSLAEKTVITGDVLEYGRRTVPSNPWFLGHFGKPYGAQPLQGINLNCNCLPRAAFKDASFDEELFYGYEDMDLCSNLLTQGYRFVHYPELINQHVPPPRGDGLNHERYRWTQRARFETSMVRYLVWENKPLLACLYFVAAPPHRLLFALRHGLWGEVPRTLFDITVAAKRAIALRFRRH